MALSSGYYTQPFSSEESLTMDIDSIEFIPCENLSLGFVQVKLPYLIFFKINPRRILSNNNIMATITDQQLHQS